MCVFYNLYTHVLRIFFYSAKNILTYENGTGKAKLSFRATLMKGTKGVPLILDVLLFEKEENQEKCNMCNLPSRWKCR